MEIVGGNRFSGIVQSTILFIIGLLMAESAGPGWLRICIPILLISPILLVSRFRSGVLTLFGLLGFVWGVWNLHGVRPDDVILETGHATDPMPVRAVGRVTDIDPDRSRGSKSVFTLSHLIDSTGTCRPFHGRLSWRFGGDHELLDGDRIIVTGWIFPPGGTGSPDPDGVDWASVSRFSGYRGRLVTPDPRLVHRLPDSGMTDRLSTLRGSLRGHCAEIVSRGVVSERERTLLLGMTTGIRGPAWNRVADPFRRTGVAHVLAISGMHLGIIIGFVVWTGRLLGVSGRTTGFSIIITTLLYLAVVSWRPPIVRSAVMAVMLSLGICVRRFPNSIGFLFLAALLLLIRNPGSLFLPGFQLSFVVVLFIMVGTRRVEHRWRRPSVVDRRPRPSGFVTGWLRTAFVVSVVAWFASVPIIMHHFGTFSPYTVPLSILLIPFLTVILGLSCMRIILSVVGLDDPLAPYAVDLLLRCVIGIVDWFDALPGSCIDLGRSPSIVIPIGLTLVLLWIRIGLRESCWKLRRLITVRSGRSGRTEPGPPNVE